MNIFVITGILALINTLIYIDTYYTAKYIDYDCDIEHIYHPHILSNSTGIYEGYQYELNITYDYKKCSYENIKFNNIGERIVSFDNIYKCSKYIGFFGHLSPRLYGCKKPEHNNNNENDNENDNKIIINVTQIIAEYILSYMIIYYDIIFILELVDIYRNFLVVYGRKLLLSVISSAIMILMILIICESLALLFDGYIMLFLVISFLNSIYMSAGLMVSMSEIIF